MCMVIVNHHLINHEHDSQHYSTIILHYPRNILDKCSSLQQNILTAEYIKLNGKPIAMESSQTKAIFSTTRFLVLLRPNFIGYLRERYLSTDIVHRCIILAVQNRTSKHIHVKQYSDSNGK